MALSYSTSEAYSGNSNYEGYLSSVITNQVISNYRAVSTVTTTLYMRAKTSYGAYNGFNHDSKIYLNGATYTKSTTTYDTRGGLGYYELYRKTVDITHNADGTKSINVGGWHDSEVVGTSSPGNSSGSNFTLNTVNVYAAFETHEQSSVTATTATISWDSDVACDEIWYQLDGGAWVQTSGYPTYTITGLSQGTTYSIKSRIRRTDTQQYTDSTAINVTTYSSASILTAESITLGDELNVTYTNPSSRTMNIAIYDNDGTDVLAAYRSCTGSSYKFTFTEDEISALTSELGVKDSVNVRVYLRTTIGATNYYDYETITLSKVLNTYDIYIKNSGTWKRGNIWTKVSGTWKKGIQWIKVNGTWKRGI